jgi:hypothetical protein
MSVVPINPFVLKAKQKLMEGLSIGDSVRLHWKDQYGIRYTHEGKITFYDGYMLRVEGDSYWLYPITFLESIEAIKKNPFMRLGA